MILLTGSTGFLGTSLINSFNSDDIVKFKRSDELKINTFSAAIHLAGKAHDLKKTTNLDEYYQVNTELTKKVFDAFLSSDAKAFITLSSVKAIADDLDGELTEDVI